MSDICYFCGRHVEVRDPYTEARLWVTGIKCRNTSGDEITISAHMGCLRANERRRDER